MHPHPTPHNKHSKNGRLEKRPPQMRRMPLVERKTLFILIVFFVFWFIVLMIWLYNNIDKEPGNIFLTKYSVTDEDIDGDGVPNWLEVLKGTDPDNPTSLAYQAEIDEATARTTEEQGGPSERTSDVLRKILYSRDGYKNVTEEEIDQIVKDSVADVTKKLSKSEDSDLVVQVDDSVDRGAVLSEFISAIQLLGAIKTPVEKIVIGAFANEKGRREEALQLQLLCQEILQKLPRRVPHAIYSQYTLFIKRVSDSCAAVDVSLLPPTADNVVLGIRLLAPTDPNAPEGGTTTVKFDVFLQSLQDIIKELSK